jgi:hypothetical protein
MDTPGPAARPWSELRDSGVLWLINRTVFHPRGFALALVMSGGQPVGWKLVGDGSEPWRFDGDEDALFAAVNRALDEARAAG